MVSNHFPFSTVGFSGSRHLSGHQAVTCKSLAAGVAALGCPVLVGCAKGADHAARTGAPSAQVFTAVSGRPGHLVQRSINLTQHLAAAPAPVLFSFPLAPCPAGLHPANRWVSCGSGSWSTAALCLGLGVPVVFFGPAAPPSFGPATPFSFCGITGQRVQPQQVTLF